jgi:hypothetical protein
MLSHSGNACAQSAGAQQLTFDIAGKQHSMQEPLAWSLHVFLASTRQFTPSDAIHDKSQAQTEECMALTSATPVSECCLTARFPLL